MRQHSTTRYNSFWKNNPSRLAPSASWRQPLRLLASVPEGVVTTAILLHPLRGSRRAMLGRATLFHRAGFAVLLIDLQGHGESPGKYISAGFSAWR